MSVIKIYVAGPMRGHPEFNFPAFMKAAKDLRALGFEVFNPAERDIDKGFNVTGMQGLACEMVDQGFSLRQALSDDTRWICEHADMIYMLNGWEFSDGALAELALAKALGLRVRYQPRIEE